MRAIEPTRAQRRQAAMESAKYPAHLVRFPEESLTAYRASSAVPRDEQPNEMWRSNKYLVQVYYEPDGIERLSIHSTEHDGTRWRDGITWDTLQRLKSECGRGDRDALEVYPSDAHVVNVANIRHLWVMPEPVQFAWRRTKRE